MSEFPNSSMAIEEFATWELMLRTSAGNGKEVLSMLESAEARVCELLTFGALEPPATVHTDQFANFTIPETIKDVLRLTDMMDEDLDDLLGFVQLVLSLCIWAIQDKTRLKYTRLIDTAAEILNSCKSLYTTGRSTQVADPAKAVSDAFIASGEFEVMFERILEDDEPALVVLRMAVSVVSILCITEELEFVIDSVVRLNKAVNRFLEFLCRDDNLLKHGSLEELTIMLTEYLSLFQDVGSNVGIEMRPLLDFFNMCIRSEKLGVQLFVIANISTFLIHAEKRYVSEFGEWSRESGFVQYLMTKDFNTEVLDRLMEIFGQLADKKMFDDSVLEQLWQRAITVHISQRNAVFQILICTMRSFDEEKSIGFLKQMWSSQELPPENIAFLSMAMTQFVSEFGIEIADILFEQAKTNETAFRSLGKEINGQLLGALRDHLIEKCMTELKTSEDRRLPREYLPRLVQSVWMAERDTYNKFQPMFFEAIPFDRPLMFSVIGLLVTGAKQMLTSAELEELTGVMDDDLWILLDRLLESCGTDATTEDGFRILNSIIEGYDFRDSTKAFADFLTTFVVVSNCRMGYIADATGKTQKPFKRLPTEYCFDHYPLLGVDYLFEMLSKTTRYEVVKRTEQSLLMFCTKYKPVDFNQVNEFIEEKYLTVIDSDVPALIKDRYLRSLLLIVQSLERGIEMGDDFMIRHALPDDIALVKITYNDVEEVSLFATQYTELGKIRDRLVKMMSAVPDFCFYHKQTYVSNYTELRKLVEDGKNVVHLTAQLGTGGRFSRRSNAKIYPSVALTSFGFAETLYEALADIYLEVAARSFLQWLPDCPKIVREIRSDLGRVISEAKARSRVQMLYTIECILNSVRFKNDFDRAEIVTAEDVEALATIFLDSEPKRDMEKLIVLLDLVITPRQMHLQSPLVAKTMNYLCDSYCSTKATAARFLRKVIDISRSTSAFADNMDLVEQVLMNVDDCTWPVIRDSIVLAEDKAPVFLWLLPFIDNIHDENKLSRYFVELFVELLPHVAQQVDMSDVLERCLKLVMTENGPVLAPVCNVASSILCGSDIRIELKQGMATKLLQKAFMCTDTTSQKSLFELACAMRDATPAVGDEIKRFLIEKMHLPFSSWSYDPERYEREDAPFAGLSNLGATCYMNSIIQQLYHIVQLRKEILSTSFESEDQKELQLLFSRLALSVRPAVDTRPFCSVWKGWGKKPVNVREQQDAGEFMNIFLDQLPESCQQWFMGTMVNRICGIDTDYDTSNVESFFTLQLDVKGFARIEESFASFLQEELFCGEDRINTEKGRIDARKFVRVRTAPPVLALHLKRFEYNMRNGRYKVTDKFEFTERISISTLMEDPQTVDTDYELKGVVLHSGNVDGGHYASLIKINGEWYKFNDTQVTKFAMTEFANETMGGRTSGFSAFMLFYSRLGSDEDFEFPVPDVVKASIEQDNSSFASTQALFSKATSLFVSKCDSTEAMISYLMNVMSHSSLEDEARTVADSTIRQIRLESKRELLYDYLETKTGELMKVYKNCSMSRVVASLNDVFGAFIVGDSLPSSLIGIVDRVIESMESIMTVWRQFEYASYIPYLCLKTWEAEISDELKHKWAKSLENLVISFYKGDVAKTVKEMVDFRTIFEILAIIYPAGQKSDLLDFWDDVTLNTTNAMPYFTFLVKSQQDMDLDRAVAFYASKEGSISRKEWARFGVTVICSSDYEIGDSLLKTAHFEDDKPATDVFLQELRRGNRVLRDKLVERCRNLVFPLLWSESTVVRSHTVLLILELFPDVVIPWMCKTCWYHDTGDVGEEWLPTRRCKDDTTQRVASDEATVRELQHMRNELLSMDEQIKAALRDCYSSVLSTVIDSNATTVTIFQIIHWMTVATLDYSTSCLASMLSFFDECLSLGTSVREDAIVQELFTALMEFPFDVLGDHLMHIVHESFGKMPQHLVLARLYKIRDLVPAETLSAIVDDDDVADYLVSILTDKRADLLGCEPMTMYEDLLSRKPSIADNLASYLMDPFSLKVKSYARILSMSWDSLSGKAVAVAASYTVHKIPVTDDYECTDFTSIMAAVAELQQREGFNEAWREQDLEGIDVDKLVYKIGRLWYRTEFNEAVVPFLLCVTVDHEQFKDAMFVASLDQSERTKDDSSSDYERKEILVVAWITVTDEKVTRFVEFLKSNQHSFLDDALLAMRKVIDFCKAVPETIWHVLVQLASVINVLDNFRAPQACMTCAIELASDEMVEEMVTSLLAHTTQAGEDFDRAIHLNPINALALICLVRPEDRSGILSRLSYRPNYSEYAPTSLSQAHLVLFGRNR